MNNNTLKKKKKKKPRKNTKEHRFMSGTPHHPAVVVYASLKKALI